MYYAGVDYHKQYSVVSILPEQGQQAYLEKRIDHRCCIEFETVFGQLQAPCRVVFEASTNWSWLYEILEKIAKVESIQLAHPYQTRLIAAAQIKTDKLDARKLAML